MISSPRGSLFARRRLLVNSVAIAGLVAAACGRESPLKGEIGKALTEGQRQILKKSAAAIATDGKPTQATLLSQPLQVHPLWNSFFGPTRSQYRSLINKAASVDEAAPRLEMARFQEGFEGRTPGQTIATLADTEPFDILLFPAAALEDLNDNKVLAPLDKVSDIGEATKAENYWPGALESGRVGGRQMAIPLQLGPWLLMYRKGRLAEYDIRDPKEWPWDTAQFSENTSRMTQVNRQNDQPDRYGFLQIVSETGASIPIPPSWVWMIAAGSDMPTRQGSEDALQDPAAITGLNVMDELINQHQSVFRTSRQGIGGSSYSSARTLRALMKDRRVSMMSFPVNSGWFLSSWRSGVEDGFELAALPRGSNHRTPTEVHLMAGASASTKHPDAVMAGLARLYRVVGQQMFPSAMRADVDLMTTVEPVLHDRDSEAIHKALRRSQPINFSNLEKEVLAIKVDQSISLGRVSPEEAAKNGAEALLEFRVNKENRSIRPPPTVVAGTG